MNTPEKKEVTKRKDAYYFSHDSGARLDPKCIKLRRTLGLEGYGIFWVLIEMLRDSNDYKLPLSSVPDIAYDARISEDKILSVINDFDLFETDNGMFFSPRLCRSMELMNAKSAKNRMNARKRWNNAKAMQSHSEGNAMKGKERKGNESKLKESKEVHPPTLDFSDYETWTKQVIAGEDPIFDQMLVGDRLNPNGSLEKLSRGHLELLARYSKTMRPQSQQTFRYSLIKHIKENATKSQETDKASKLNPVSYGTLKR